MQTKYSFRSPVTHRLSSLVFLLLKHVATSNSTFRAELGRATWKFLHTMVAQFPEKPLDSERKTLEIFFYLFARLYPCGDCARHFRKVLKKYPPQTSSRNAAAGWLCAAHNIVNQRLKKPDFDCTKIGDFYDCGCGDNKKEMYKDEEESEKKLTRDVTWDQGGGVTAPRLGALAKQWSKAAEGI